MDSHILVLVMSLDHYDIAILEVLQKSARLSNQELADQINLTPSPCLRRVRHLEEKGYIKSSTVVLDRSRLNLDLMVLVYIAMDKHTEERLSHFVTEIVKIPEVLTCDLIAGHMADYMLRIVVPNMDYYQSLLIKRISSISGVREIRSSFVLRQPLNRTELPLNHL